MLKSECCITHRMYKKHKKKQCDSRLLLNFLKASLYANNINFGQDSIEYPT